jgi:TolA-binding protein
VCGESALLLLLAGAQARDAAAQAAAQRDRDAARGAAQLSDAAVQQLQQAQGRHRADVEALQAQLAAARREIQELRLGGGTGGGLAAGLQMPEVERLLQLGEAQE